MKKKKKKMKVFPLGGPGPTPEPDEDPPVLVMADPVLSLRYHRLMAAGYSPFQAVEITFRRDIDLHDAEGLAKKAGADLATEILL